MSNLQQTLQRPAPVLTPGYVTVWAVLATLALGYLALLVVRPDIAERLLAPPAVGSPEDNRGQRALTKALAEIKDLRQTAKVLERELAEVRAAMTAGEVRDTALTARVATVEAALQKLAAPVAVPPIASPASQPGDPLSPAQEPRIVGHVEERPTKAARDPRPVEPPKPAVTAAGPPISARPAAGVGVQIASGPSLDAVRLSWQLMQDSHKAAFKALEPRVVEVPGDPPSFKLLAGPLSTGDEAEKLCERLRQRRVTCTVQPYAGKPL